MSDRYAPAGKVWFCMMCGKTTKDCYGEERGWDESCALNSILVDEATKQPTEEQAREFHEERARHLASFKQRSDDLLKQLRDGTYEPDPELLKLAEEVIRQQDAARDAKEVKRG
jgi:hypothetical protein